MVITLVAMVVKDSSPVGPLNEAVRSGIVDDLAPCIVRSKWRLGRSQAAVNAVFAAGQQGDAGKFVFEGKVVDNEAVKLEAPSMGI